MGTGPKVWDCPACSGTSKRVMMLEVQKLGRAQEKLRLKGFLEPDGEQP